MKRIAFLVVATLALLFSLVVALAATQSEEPNDPALNPDANACYTGGSMAGKCKLDDELWIAGWYAIRFEHGLISSDQIPDAYKWLLGNPPATEEPIPLPTATFKPV